jgi:hypothetical protein
MQDEQAFNINASLCRCCLMGAKENPLVNMRKDTFAYNNKSVTYYDGYFAVSGCDLKRFHQIPINEYKICQTCMVQLESAFIFRKLCSEANKILENHFIDNIEAGPSNRSNTKVEQNNKDYTTPIVKREIETDSDDEVIAVNLSGEKAATTNHSQNPMKKVNVIIQKMKKKRKQIEFGYMFSKTGPPTTPFKCSMCPKSYEILPSVIRHYKTEHEQVRHECKICNIKYRNLTGLWSHSFSHRGFKPYNCPHCDFECIDKRKFYNHLMRIHRVVYDEVIHGYTKETHAEVLSFVSDRVKVDIRYK